MRRRTRVDLGQEPTRKEEEQLERRRKRWASVNKNRPEHENPFLAAIKPENVNYGDPEENSKDIRERLERLEFGNYPGYFNYRNKAATTAPTPADPATSASTIAHHETNKAPEDDHQSNALDAGLVDERLQYLKEEWFKGKNVLDIGCNRGHITYAIAKLFSPHFILGIDIDLKMVHMANRDLHLHLEEFLLKHNNMLRVERAYKLFSDNSETTVDRNESESKVQGEGQQYTEDPDHYSLSSYVALGPLASSTPDGLKSETNDDKDDKQIVSDDLATNDINEPLKVGKFPNNILFVEHNYVLARDELVDKQSAYFDTIVCLSVTKWIHLNYRDDGIKRFLRRIHRHLKPGGLLILEAQPYDNYFRKKKLSDRLRSNYYSIKFKPEQFDEYLLSEEVGFREILLSTKTDHDCEGFKRPLKVYLK